MSRLRVGNPENAEDGARLFAAQPRPLGAGRAFTLIELLIVIAIVAVLAALLFTSMRAANRAKVRTKARGELAQVQSAIESYAAALGHYPPDNRGSPAVNPLYFELLGTTNGGTFFATLDHSAEVATSALGATFGTSSGVPNVSGFVNCEGGGQGDERRPARNFMAGLKPSQIGELSPGVKLLVSSIPWPSDLAFQPTPTRGLNPFRYVSSAPAHNRNSFDLWVDVVIGGQTNRISNWSAEVLINPAD